MVVFALPFAFNLYINCIPLIHCLYSTVYMETLNLVHFLGKSVIHVLVRNLSGFFVNWLAADNSTFDSHFGSIVILDNVYHDVDVRFVGNDRPTDTLSQTKTQRPNKDMYINSQLYSIISNSILK